MNEYFTEKITINGEETEIIVPVIYGTLDLNTGVLTKEGFELRHEVFLHDAVAPEEVTEE